MYNLLEELEESLINKNILVREESNQLNSLKKKDKRREFECLLSQVELAINTEKYFIALDSVDREDYLDKSQEADQVCCSTINDLRYAFEEDEEATIEVCDELLVALSDTFKEIYGVEWENRHEHADLRFLTNI